MSRRLARFVAPGLAMIGTFLAQGPARAGDDRRPIDRLVGERVVNFALNDAVDGKRVSLYGYYGKKAVVLVFTGTECPIGNQYLPRLVELNARYRDRGVVFLGINSNASESAEDVAAHAKEFGLDFPVLKDPTGRVAMQLEAERTCEALVLDGAARLRYRGAIDDQYGYGVRKEGPTRNFLVDAIEAVLAGEKPETSATSVEGCPIERVEAQAANRARVRPATEEVIAALGAIDPPVDPDSIGPVNFAEHVAPILRQRCEVCHRPGQVAPFALQTYAQARRWSASIPEAVEDLRMPPWHADPRFGHFANDRRLTARERATLIAWVEQGTPEGDPAKLPPPREWPEGWTIGEPDAIFAMPEPYTVKADGALPYQRFRVETGFTEEKWVKAIELMPGERSVIHHIIVYLRDAARGDGFENMEHFASYAPGDLATRLPEGTAKRIPAGAELVFELHYTPIGKVVVDRSRVGFVFADGPPKYRVVTQAIPNMQFQIPPGADAHEVKSKREFSRDVVLLGFLPHMHLRGKDFTYTATYPDDREPEVLLSVPRYDFAWQSYYWLAEPKPLPKGTRIDCVAHFDNSTSNPALTEADTREEVRWGEQTWEEMMIGFVDVMVPVEPESDAKAAASNDRRGGSRPTLGRVVRALARGRSSPSTRERGAVAERRP